MGFARRSHRRRRVCAAGCVPEVLEETACVLGEMVEGFSAARCPSTSHKWDWEAQSTALRGPTASRRRHRGPFSRNRSCPASPALAGRAAGARRTAVNVTRENECDERMPEHAVTPHGRWGLGVTRPRGQEVRSGRVEKFHSALSQPFRTHSFATPAIHSKISGAP